MNSVPIASQAPVTQLVIEMRDENGMWITTSDGPLPHSTMDGPQSLSFPVWLAYVRYLNIREVEKTGELDPRFRIVRWTTTRKKEVVT